MSVLGFDLSLTSTGIAWAHEGSIVAVDNIKSSGTNKDRYPQHLQRIRKIAAEIEWSVLDTASSTGAPEVALLEAPSYGSRNGKPHERAGLWWRVFEFVHDQFGIPILAIAPTTRAKYITGSGKADKALVLQHAEASYGEVIENHDIADAAGLAAMGARALNEPIVTELLDAEKEKAFKGVPWQSLLHP